MTNFSQVMRDWHRMCDKMDKIHGDEACSHCPICQTDAAKYGCDAIYTEWAANVDWDKVASIVEAWAAKNPEPAYPTFREWLIDIGVISDMYTHSVIADKIATTHIPPDIAEKLGLEPKGGNSDV